MAGRLLVIGATGFAGGHLADAAVGEGMDVIRAGRRVGRVDLACDVLDQSSLERALRDARPDMVANLAGSPSVAAGWRDPARAFELNAIGTLNLLEAAAEACPDAHLMCVSSGEVYGEVPRGELPVGEARLPDPLSPYAASKAAMELICGQYTKTRGLRIAVVRAFNHLGPGQSDTFAASSFARQIAEAERDGLEIVTV
jgi:GDP-4-dehydro-6-deoxy-D-mannose reductase